MFFITSSLCIKSLNGFVFCLFIGLKVNFQKFAFCHFMETLYLNPVCPFLPFLKISVCLFETIFHKNFGLVRGVQMMGSHGSTTNCSTDSPSLTLHRVLHLHRGTAELPMPLHSRYFSTFLLRATPSSQSRTAQSTSRVASFLSLRSSLPGQ